MMTLIEELLILTAFLSISLLWAMMILVIAKYTKGKNAPMWFILLTLLVAGPFGWAVLCIISITSMIDDITEMAKKVSKKSKKGVDK